MKILIIKLSAIGDVVQSLCVLDALRHKFPDAEIHWLAGEAAAALVSNHSMINEVIVYPRKRLGELCSSPLTWPLLASEGRKFLHELRLHSYDIVIDLQGLLKSGVLAWLSHGKRKIGFAAGREASSIFLNEKLPPYDPDEHAVLRYMRIAYHLGADSGRAISFPLCSTDREQQQASALLESRGISPGRFIGLIPGTRWETKHWTPEGFAAVSDMIMERTRMDVAVLGSGSDSRLASEISSLSQKGIHDLTGTTDLRTLGALLSMSAAVISTDTGPMHLAAAAGTKIVALFGPTSPERTGPFTQKSRVVTASVGCRPCFRRNCEDPRCMRRIAASDVAESLMELMEQ